MAQSSNHHPEEDLVPIQNFMRRFSHVEPGQEESTRLSRDEGEVTIAAAATVMQPTTSQRIMAWLMSAFQSGPTPPPLREPERYDIIVLSISDVKKWLTSHPKASITIVAFMLATVIDRMPFYDGFHRTLCRCIEDETCYLAFVLKRVKFLVLCV
ncbi:hypothetical protein KC19_VG208400 [Ceratodon purpureus]|uniref:Uncharacterized protein n=1 Tax=Ceratodon purpureus TaxID=3225 RepID=A0A8T0HS38_CERPU|nr:hypothetical protein KC19_VG208400 [Ceratodon purpureus]KAG0573773.1 hypothetical protein KC19_VG208400 [Ceratodon purpureus]